jgi:hypothetical protein
MKEQTGQPVQLEGTYTNLHINNKYSVTDFMDYAYERFGVGFLHMPVNAVDDSSRIHSQAIKSQDFELMQSYYADAVSQSTQSLVTKPVDKICVLSSALEIIEAFFHLPSRKRYHFCRFKWRCLSLLYVLS